MSLLPEHIFKIEEPTDSRQVLHLMDMDYFFGNDVHMKDLNEAMMLNYAYGVEYCKDFNEFCDTMYTALYWMNQKYAHLCQIDKESEALKLSSDVERGQEIDDEAYRYDILFGAWMSFVTRDKVEWRTQFLGELSGMNEDQFILNLHGFAQDLTMIETFTVSWIKKMIDPCRAATYGHYMMYMMVKVMSIMKESGEDIELMNQVLTSLCIFTQSASKLCSMNEHNMPMN